VVLVGERGGSSAAAPAPGTLCVRPPALHGRRVHHPHGEPLDLGFAATQGMHDAVAARPWLNSLLAALNTVSALPCLTV